MKKTIVLLNGPPQSGKDTLADRLVENHGFHKLKFAGRLFQDLKIILGMDDETFRYYREEGKDTPLVGDTTFRQMAINYSERVVKPRYGQDCWSEQLEKEILLLDHDKIVISDLGFNSEMMYFINSTNIKEYLLLCCRIKRKGCDFSNDSRKYVKYFDIELENNGSIQELCDGFMVSFNFFWKFLKEGQSYEE